MHVLINCDEVKPYPELFMQYHRINEEDASGLIHEQFPSWLKEYVNDERNGTHSPYMKALTLGPNPKTTSWHIYFINEYKFHTEEWSRDNTEDEMPYQSDEMSPVVPITELE
ncbi:unnamed protein product [Vicia faba]|uniref:Uncharacterized protein n=1 Tax=Vicia faba TaxID=3906 RepID=A0AAV0ZIU6_VICFA|nr:unnamed protein product [Vicia faba]